MLAIHTSVLHATHPTLRPQCMHALTMRSGWLSCACATNSRALCTASCHISAASSALRTGERRIVEATLTWAVADLNTAVSANNMAGYSYAATATHGKEK